MTNFKEISKDYNKINEEVGPAYYNFLQNYYYPRCEGKIVLDIGNGGQHPTKVFGRIKPSYFVGLDSSIDMLRRNEGYVQICADVLHIPFKDETFDYVIIQDLIHHIGCESFDAHSERLRQLFKECLRVCKKEIIISECITSRYLEMAEKFVSKIIGGMDIFVFSPFMLEDFIKQCNAKMEELRIKSLSELISPFYWHIIFIKLKWFKLPAFLNPFRQSFFVIKK